MKQRTDLAKKLNLNYTYLTNKTNACGPLDLPEVYCDLPYDPDYIALHSHPSDYCHTEHTAVAFFNYDDSFDGENGLFNAIYYHDEKRLNYYKERFSNVHTFIAPDYSVCGDIHAYENHWRIAKSRIVSIWATVELNALVVPLLKYGSERDFPYMLDGLEQTRTIAVSTKCKLRNKKDRQLLETAVQIAVDNLKWLDKIIVYDASGTGKDAKKLLKYAEENGVRVVIPDNILKTRNRHLHEVN